MKTASIATRAGCGPRPQPAPHRVPDAVRRRAATAPGRDRPSRRRRHRRRRRASRRASRSGDSRRIRPGSRPRSAPTRGSRRSEARQPRRRRRGRATELTSRRAAPRPGNQIDGDRHLDQRRELEPFEHQRPDLVGDSSVQNGNELLTALYWEWFFSACEREPGDACRRRASAARPTAQHQHRRARSPAARTPVLPHQPQPIRPPESQNSGRSEDGMMPSANAWRWWPSQARSTAIRTPRPSRPPSSRAACCPGNAAVKVVPTSAIAPASSEGPRAATARPRPCRANRRLRARARSALQVIRRELGRHQHAQHRARPGDTSHRFGCAEPNSANTVVKITGSGFQLEPPAMCSCPWRISRPQISHDHGS